MGLTIIGIVDMGGTFGASKTFMVVFFDNMFLRLHYLFYKTQFTYWPTFTWSNLFIQSNASRQHNSIVAAPAFHWLCYMLCLHKIVLVHFNYYTHRENIIFFQISRHHYFKRSTIRQICDNVENLNIFYAFGLQFYNKFYCYCNLLIIGLKMGAKITKGESIKIDEDQWIQTQQESRGAKIVQNKSTNEIGELRVIPIDPKHEINKQLQIYEYRNKRSPLLRCLGAKIIQGKSKAICGSEQTSKVITERIPNLWSELPLRSHQQGFYALRQSLQGFGQLYDKAGVFKITPNMIGLNDQGEVKVWLNQNFALNHPNFEMPVLQKVSSTSNPIVSESQSNMVNDVIRIIGDRCETGALPPKFLKSLGPQMSFEEASDLTDEYIMKNNVKVPQKIDLKQERNYIQCTTMDNRPFSFHETNNSRYQNSFPQPTAVSSFHNPIIRQQPTPIYRSISPSSGYERKSSDTQNLQSYQNPQYKPLNPEYQNNYYVSNYNNNMSSNYNGNYQSPFAIYETSEVRHVE